MDSLEKNHEEWERIRTRADSLANAVFLIAGGAMSVSISVMIAGKSSGIITESASAIAASAWYWLLSAIILFVVLKVHMIFQAFLLHVKTAFADKHNVFLNTVGWFIGIGGFVSFTYGLIQMVRAASAVIVN